MPALWLEEEFQKPRRNTTVEIMAQAWCIEPAESENGVQSLSHIKMTHETLAHNSKTTFSMSRNPFYKCDRWFSFEAVHREFVSGLSKHHKAQEENKMVQKCCLGTSILKAFSGFHNENWQSCTSEKSLMAPGMPPGWRTRAWALDTGRGHHQGDPGWWGGITNSRKIKKR